MITSSFFFFTGLVSLCLGTRSSTNMNNFFKKWILLLVGLVKICQSMPVHKMLSQGFVLFEILPIFAFQGSYWMRGLSRHVSPFCRSLQEGWVWKLSCHSSIRFFYQYSFWFGMKPAICWKWLSHCYFCPREQNMLKVKKKERIELDPDMMGIGLSWFSSIAVSVVVISIRQMNDLQLQNFVWCGEHLINFDLFC